MKNIICIIISGLVILSSCKMKKTDEQEIQKLLDRQAQMKTTQEKSVDRLMDLRDSLASEKEHLMQRREQKNEQVRLLKSNQQLLVEKLKQTEESDVSGEKAELKDKISRYDDSINALDQEVAGLDVRIDSVGKNLEFYSVQEGQAKKVLASGVAEIDQRMKKLESRRQQESKNADLLKRRIEIAGKKIEAFEMERQMYVDERDDLLRKNASKEQLAPYREKIAEMDSVISGEQSSRNSLQQDLEASKHWLEGVDKNISDLESKIKQEYNKKDIVEGFIASEKERLQNEISSLESDRKKLVGEQERISGELEGMQARISLLSKESELIRNRNMSEILEKQADLDRTEAKLAGEEVGMLDKASQLAVESPVRVSDSASEELKSLVLLGDQLDSLRSSIELEKKAIAETRVNLNEKRAEAASRRAGFSRSAGVVVVVIVLGLLGLLTLFYFLGKRARQKH